MDSAKTLEAARTAVFGPNPTLGTDGQPLERGVGSPWHRAAHIAKAHYHAADAVAACEQLVSLAKQINALSEKVTAAAKAAIQEAAAAQQEEPVPTVTQPDVLHKLPEPTVNPVPQPPPEPVNLSFDIPGQ